MCSKTSTDGRCNVGVEPIRNEEPIRDERCARQRYGAVQPDLHRRVQIVVLHDE